MLDIGCGSGRTTREAARIARAGSALGVDISAPAIERARELARVQGAHNVTFECADAQVHAFPLERFDLAMSRFGTMFFDDPCAAFANIGRALRPGGRLVMMVWQAHDDNEWEVAIRRSLAGPDGAPAVPSAAPGPFSLADPPVVNRILEGAGFAGVTITDVREPMYFGPDVAAAFDWVCGYASTRDVIGRLDSAAAARALGRLRKMLAAHLSGDGVWFDSRAWIVTARGLLSLARKETGVVTTAGQDGSAEDGYDPMRQFAELAGDVRDPYPMFAGIRADSPVMEVHFGPESSGTARLDQKAPRMTSLFTVTSHELAQQVLTDNARFSSAGTPASWGRSWGGASCRWTAPSICAIVP